MSDLLNKALTSIKTAKRAGREEGDNMVDSICVFCKIGKGHIPSEFLFRDKDVFAIRDINPMAPDHLLIIPFAHIETLVTDAPIRGQIITAMLSAVIALVKRLRLDRRGYRLVLNQGTDSGQEVPHLHLHLLAGRRLGSIC